MSITVPSRMICPNSQIWNKKHKEIHWQPKEEEVMRSQQHLLLVRCRQASEVLLVLVTVVLVTSFLRLIWCNRCTATICWRLPHQLNDQFAILGQHDNLPKHTNMHNIHNIYSEYSWISWIFYIILWYITLTLTSFHSLAPCASSVLFSCVGPQIPGNERVHFKRFS